MSNWQPLTEWSDELRQRAIEVAVSAGWTRPSGQDFARYWSRIPVGDAPGIPIGLTEPAHGARILFSSGGSTGTPKFTSLTMAEVFDNCEVHGRSYRAAGIVPEDVVAVWGLPGLMSSEFTVYLALMHAGCAILPIGVAEPAEIVGQLQNLRASVLLVMPSDLLPVARLLDQTGQRLPSVRLVLTGGEALYPADEQRYRPLFGPEVSFRSTFQTSEVGALGYQCGACRFGEYHVHSDLQLAEVVDIGPDGTGELITTNLARTLSPVVRQRTGDRAFVLSGPCPCGLSEARIQLRGRLGRLVNFGGEKFDVDLLARLRGQLGLRTDDFLLELGRDDSGRDRFTLRSDRLEHEPALQEQVRDYFAALSPKVAAQLRQGNVAEIAFAGMDGTAPEVTVAGKTKDFVDRR